MANQRSTFSKRQREADLKDKARAKRERRASKATEVRPTKGPEIDWDHAAQAAEELGTPAPIVPPAAGVDPPKE